VSDKNTVSPVSHKAEWTGNVAWSPMMDKRLTDRIRELSAQAVSTPEGPELEKIIRELREALNEHIQRLRERAWLPPEDERRSPR